MVSLTPQSTSHGTGMSGPGASLTKQGKLAASAATRVVIPSRGLQQARTPLWMKIPPHVNNPCGRGESSTPLSQLDKESPSLASHISGCRAPQLPSPPPHRRPCPSHIFGGGEGREWIPWLPPSLRQPKQATPKVSFTPQVLKVLGKPQRHRESPCPSSPGPPGRSSPPPRC